MRGRKQGGNREAWRNVKGGGIWNLGSRIWSIVKGGRGVRRKRGREWKGRLGKKEIRGKEKKMGRREMLWPPWKWI